jgi:hypothetical protein
MIDANKTLLAVALSFSCLVTMPAQAAIAEHFGKTIAFLEVADSPCIFFQLTGATQANPIVPGGVWFAFSKTQDNYKEMYAMLLTMRVSGTPVTRVLTDGGVVCGVAKVLTIDF